jgi:hypothetical protein
LNEIDCVDGFHNLQCSYDKTSGIETIGFSSNPTFASVNSTTLYSQICTCGNLQVGSNGTVLIRVIDPNNNLQATPNPILTQGNITFSTTPTYATVTTTGNANVGGNITASGSISSLSSITASSGTITAGTQNPGTNNAAGDIRGFRLSINGNSQFLPGNGEFLQIGANVADTAAGLVYGGVMTTNLIAPSASSSTISGYLIIGQTASFGGANTSASYSSVSAAQTVFQHNTASSFTLAAAHTFGVTFSTNTFSGTIGNAVSVNVSPLSIVGTSAGTITNLIGVRVLPPQAGSLTVNNIYGSYITAQTAANGSVIVVGQRIDAPSPCGSGVCAAQYFADTTGSTAGGINFGADTTLYRSAAGVLRTDGPFWAGSSSLNNIRLAPGASNAISYINAGSNSLAVNPPSGSSFYVMNGGIVNMQFQSVSGSTTYLRSTPSVSAGHTLQAWSDTDTNENFNLYSKGAGVMNLGTGGVRTIQLLQSTPSDVNYLTFTSASGGNSPVISAAGTDTNSDVKVAPKGTGVLNVAGGVTASGILSGQVATPTPRALIAKLQDQVSVKDYGAVGDNVTDDTTAIQTAINACKSSTPGTMCTTFFPEGIYRFSALSVPGYSALRGADMYSTVLRVLAGSTVDYCMATSTYIAGTASLDSPVHFFDLTLDGQNRCNSTLVLRTFYPILNRVQVCGGGVQNLQLTTVTQNGTQLTGGLSDVNGRITNSNFGSMACNTAAAYDVLVNDPGAQMTDWFVEGNFFSGNTGGTATSNIGGLQTSAGWAIRGNHFYGVPVSSYNLVLRGADYGTVVSNNVFESSVQITAGFTGNVTGARFGPGNVIYSGVLMASFGTFGNRIVSIGNNYDRGYIQHDFFSSSKVLVSQGDSFYNYQPYRWTNGASTGVVIAMNSWNGYSSNMMNFATDGANAAQFVNTPFFYKMTTYPINNGQLTYVARTPITASSNSLSFSITVPGIPAGTNTGYHVKALCVARTNQVSTVQLNYMMDGIVIQTSGGAYGFTIASETITGAQFSVNPAYSAATISDTLMSITMTATFANVVSNTAYGECILECL